MPTEFTLWKIAAIGFGLIFGLAIIAFMNQINFLFYPKPESFNGSNELYHITLSSNPHFLSGKIISIITGSFFAGALTGFVNRYVLKKEIIVAAIILLAVGFIDLVTAAYPIWYWVLSVCMYIPSALSGFYFIRKIQNTNEV